VAYFLHFIIELKLTKSLLPGIVENHHHHGVF
jgi:hypothetical protein